MKKFLPTLLIAIILVNLFAPFSVAVNTQKKIEFRQNVVKAEIKPEQQKAIDDAKKEQEDALAAFKEAAAKKNADGSSFYTKEELNRFAQAVTDAEKKLKQARSDAGLFDDNADKVSVVPECSIGIGSGSFTGCIAILFTAVFEITSALFGLAGIFFDNMFAYSVNDDSYRSSFVLEGWGLVRDIVNMFFIFVLLYVAFTTILGIGGGHGPKPKDLIVNVVIVGLLINFSLFATQVIIDTSNILARVFYNSRTISVSKDGEAVNTDSGKPIPMSEIIVSKVNPQKLIGEGLAKVGKIDKSNSATTPMSEKDLKTSDAGAGVYILVTTLAIVINVIGFIVFLTVGLLFVARVIGLWLAMVVVPFTFFSYTVPQLADMDMIGHKKWWPETIKMAFLAPVFMFFLYLIIKFVSLDSLIPINSENGAAFILATMVPFIFIMVLMWQAKSIASKLAGSIGSTVTNVGMAMGGLALGGAALGAAALGRQTIGATAKYMQNEKAMEKTVKLGGFKDQWKKGVMDGKLNPFAYAKEAGKFMTAGTAKILGKIPTGKMDDGHGVKISANLKERMQRSEEAFRDQGHAKTALDGAAATLTHDKEMTYSQLAEPEQKKAREMANQDELAKAVFGVKFEKIEDAGQRMIIKDAVTTYMNGGETGDLKADRPTIRDASGNVILAGKPDIVAAHDGVAMAKMLSASQAMGEFSTALRRGSMDIRNLSQSKFQSKGLMKMGVGFASVVATGVRMGLKSGLKVDPGSGQKDFMKDLGNTLETALKGMKIDVKVDGGGGHAKADAGHGGGAHH